ncbi:Hapless protein [Hirschfeldia incana]|nr:Hapless protein [Hirschfeldia incana]KAJ0266978.1 Hapless protein [Hirschfeldia incana]
MFLSTKNPPHDHHPLPSSSFLHLTPSSSHELAQSHPQRFSIRDYAYSNRKKNKIKNNWPFSPKSLQLLSTHGVTDPLPPFEITASSSSRKQKIVSHVQRGRDLAKLELHQTIAKTRKAVCSRSRIVENGLFTSTSVSKSKEEVVLVAATTSNNSKNKYSKTCGRGGGMVKSKEASCVGVESIMASSKTCPICKTFSSASNTTLNAHIDQCISADSPVVSKPDKPRVNHQCLSVDSDVPLVSSKPIKNRGKPRMKVKTMVDIYASAKRCTLADLDKRNGTKWAVISSYTTNRVVADKSDVSKKRKVPPVGVGPVYVDAKGQKLRIITEFSVKKTYTTLMREQGEDGGNKKSSSQGSKENSNGSRKRRQGRKHHKYIKLSSHKTNESEVPECQRGFSGEGSSSTGHRRVFNQRMLAKRGSSLKKLNEKGDKVNALQDQPSEDDDDDSWSGGDHVVLRGTALNRQKLRSEVSGRKKTMFVTKRAQRVRMSDREEKSLAGGAHINTIRLKRSLTSIQEDKYPQKKNAREVTDASPRASSMRKLLPPFVANGWRRLSLPVELKRSRFDLSSEDEETGKWESEMTVSDDDYVSDDNEERNEVLHRSNPSTFSGYKDYDDEESSEEEEEANVLDKTDDTGAEFYQSDTPLPIIPSERAMYYSEEVENMVYEEEDVRFDSVVGKGSLYLEVDTIPIPGPPGSFIPSPRGGMSYDEPLGNSSVITSQLHSSIDQLDRHSSESPVSAFSHFAAGRLSFPAELFSVDVPLSYSTTPLSFSVPSHPDKMTADKTSTTPSSFRNTGQEESCCCQRKERISEGFTLNHQPSQLLQRRAAASSSIPMNLTKSPTRLDPNHPFEQSPYMIQQEFDLHSKFSSKANVNGAVVPPSPSNSVLRLMGKDLMVINQGEASLASLTPSPQFLDPPPCAGDGLYLNTGLYLRNSLEPIHQPHTQASSAFRNNFEHVRYFSPS